MKKALTTLIALAIFSLPLHAIAAVKSGASCTKLGATSTYAGKKYICIKSGKKLVWNKGIAIATPKPTPSPSLTPSLEPTPVPINTPSASPTPTASKFVPPYIPKTFAELENNISGIIYGAWINTLDQMRAGKSQLGNIEIFLKIIVSPLDVRCMAPGVGFFDVLGCVLRHIKWAWRDAHATKIEPVAIPARLNGFVWVHLATAVVAYGVAQLVQLAACEAVMAVVQ